MVVTKKFLVILALCLVHQSFSKPTLENDVSEGRGILYSFWEWITYPITWWSSAEPDQPLNEPLIETTTVNSNDVIVISNSNVTIWCDDQTCTTMRCDNNVCKNVTCNLYDTDLRGECRKYNILPEIPDENAVPDQTANTETTSTAQVSTEKPVDEKNDVPIPEEHPLALETALSSTVNNKLTEHSGTHEEETSSESKNRKESVKLRQNNF